MQEGRAFALAIAKHLIHYIRMALGCLVCQHGACPTVAKGVEHGPMFSTLNGEGAAMPREFPAA